MLDWTQTTACALFLPLLLVGICTFAFASFFLLAGFLLTTWVRLPNPNDFSLASFLLMFSRRCRSYKDKLYPPSLESSSLESSSLESSSLESSSLESSSLDPLSLDSSLLDLDVLSLPTELTKLLCRSWLVKASTSPQACPFPDSETMAISESAVSLPQ